MDMIKPLITGNFVCSKEKLIYFPLLEYAQYRHQLIWTIRHIFLSWEIQWNINQKLQWFQGSQFIKIDIRKPLDKSISIHKLNISVINESLKLVIDVINFTQFIDRLCSLVHFLETCICRRSNVCMRVCICIYIPHISHSLMAVYNSWSNCEHKSTSSHKPTSSPAQVKSIFFILSRKKNRM